MTGALDVLADVLVANGLIAAFLFVGVVVWISYLVSAKLTCGQLHGSAIAILTGLVLAYAGGIVTGGDQGPGHRGTGRCRVVGWSNDQGFRHHCHSFRRAVR